MITRVSNTHLKHPAMPESIVASLLHLPEWSRTPAAPHQCQCYRFDSNDGLGSLYLHGVPSARMDWQGIALALVAATILGLMVVDRMMKSPRALHAEQQRHQATLAASDRWWREHRWAWRGLVLAFIGVYALAAIGLLAAVW